jgi:hypothetical protein
MGSLYAWASPETISHLTMPQLLIYLNAESAGGPPANAFRNQAELQAYVDEQRRQKGLK